MLLPVLGSSLAAAAAPAAGDPSPALWIIDWQIPGAAAISAAAQSERAEILEFSADPGQVWMNALAPRLNSAPLALGGYTNASVLFCIHYLARDFGMTLARVADDVSAPALVPHDPGALIDLRAARFSNRAAAYTWLMLPRSA